MIFGLAAVLAYTPFRDPIPWWNGWFWWSLPLCLGVAVVYKCTKCERVADVPVQALVIFVWMMLGLVVTAAGLYGLVAMMKSVAGG